MPAPASPSGDSAYDHAVAYGELGLRVLPIKPGEKRPPMSSWQHAATNERKAIDSWFTGLYRNAGVGIAMGQQPNGLNLIAIDVDEHDPAHSGSDTIAEYEAVFGPLPETWRAITGSGGAHLIYSLPADVELTNGTMGPGVDTRGQGGQIVVAPTIHPATERAYQWEADHAPWEQDIAPLPQWCIDILTPEPEPPRPPEPTERTTLDGDTPADWLRASWDWRTELERAGWHLDHTGADGDTRWRRPGKPGRTEGISAVLHEPDGPFVVWSTDAELGALRTAGRPNADGSVSVSPLQFYAAEDHDGDISAASRSLRGEMSDDTPELRVKPGETENPELPSTETDPWGIINWSEFWSEEHTSEEWLAEPILAKKRGHALVAPGGGGKSLLSLWLTAGLATGQPLLQNTGGGPVHVLYVDYEMTKDDLSERLEEMGYGPDSDLSHLHYAQHPSIDAMDTKDGGLALALKAEQLGVQLVVIDTYGRAVEGDENEADTTRAFYRHTAGHLKRMEIAFLRIDHLGKDPTKGARGSSAKRDDVDIVWELTAREEGAIALKATKRRTNWVPENVALTKIDEPELRYRLTEGVTWPAGTKDVAERLEALDVPSDATVRTSRAALSEAGERVSSRVLSAAVKWRKEGAQRAVFEARNTLRNRGAEQGSEQSSGTEPGTPRTQGGTDSVTVRNKEVVHVVEQPSLEGCNTSTGTEHDDDPDESLPF